MPDREDIVEQLRFLGELGVRGSSGDSRWRQRSGDVLRSRRSIAPELAGAGESSSLAAAHVEPIRAAAVVAGAVATDPSGRLDAVRQDLGACTRCKLHGLGRQQIVFGVGNPAADLMFVGEAPGQDEDRQGVPFVGRAGQLLTRIIESIGLTRDDVYIANVIKCRPPKNRNPDPDEVAQCEPFLFGQVDAIAPKVIVALGKFAAQALLRSTEPISRLRGHVYDYRGARLIPTFHPAYLLRNPSGKREVWEDMKKVRAILRDE